MAEEDYVTRKKVFFQFLPPLSLLVNYARYRLRFFAVSDIGRDLQNRTKKFANTTCGLGSAPKTKIFGPLLNFN